MLLASICSQGVPAEPRPEETSPFNLWPDSSWGLWRIPECFESGICLHSCILGQGPMCLGSLYHSSLSYDWVDHSSQPAIFRMILATEGPSPSVYRCQGLQACLPFPSHLVPHLLSPESTAQSKLCCLLLMTLSHPYLSQVFSGSSPGNTWYPWFEVPL